MKIEIKSVFGSLLFDYECKNNTIKKTLLEAIKSNANLYNADLYNADLRNADLRNADLRNADLRNANLYNANLYNVKNKESSFIPIYCKWNISIIGSEIKIGCKQKSIDGWDIFFSSNEVYETERNTEDFKRIEAMYNAYKSYLLTLKK